MQLGAGGAGCLLSLMSPDKPAAADCSSAAPSSSERELTGHTMRRHSPIHIWQVVLSGVVLVATAMLGVALFSQGFDFGDDVIKWLLFDAWEPCAPATSPCARGGPCYYFPQHMPMHSHALVYVRSLSLSAVHRHHVRRHNGCVSRAIPP